MDPVHPASHGSTADARFTEEEVRILRNMTPARKIAVMHALVRRAYEPPA